MTITLHLSSEAYGSEQFKFDGEQELLQKILRLLADAKKHTRIDKVEREIVIRVQP